MAAGVYMYGVRGRLLRAGVVAIPVVSVGRRSLNLTRGIKV